MFGVNLDVLITRENPGQSNLDNIVPRAFEACLKEIEERESGLQEAGLCELLTCSPVRQIVNKMVFQIVSQVPLVQETN